MKFPISTIAINSAITVFSCVVSIVILEAVVRYTADVPLFAVEDWRTVNAQKSTARYDSRLGWVHRENVRSDSTNAVNTIDHGIRRNTLDQAETIEKQAILAVGDSFTAGSEVEDNESWPAHLQALIGERVLNAGVGGFGVDQIILRAEQLIPIVQPKTVLVGVLAPDDVRRAQFSSYGGPKPYFLPQGDEFVLRNVPVPRVKAENTPAIDALRRSMARVYSFHMIFSRLAPQWWYTRANVSDDAVSHAAQTYEKVANNPIQVSCYLFRRLGAKLSATDTRGLLVLQHGGWVQARQHDRSYDADELIQCAAEAGFGVVDEFDSLRTIVEGSLSELQSHYVMHDNNSVYGHMSSKGNALVANLIADALKNPTAPAVKVAEALPTPEGDGLNRLTATNITSLAHTEAQVLEDKPIHDGAIVQRLVSTDYDGEHYGALAWSGTDAGAYTFSVYIRSDPGTSVRLQLHDDKGNGVIADYASDTELFDLLRIGNGRKLRFRSAKARNGWTRLSLGATLGGTKGTVLIQLSNGLGVTSFGLPAVTLDIQAPMVETGASPSPWCHPTTCKTSG